VLGSLTYVRLFPLYSFILVRRTVSSAADFVCCAVCDINIIFATAIDIGICKAQSRRKGLPYPRRGGGLGEKEANLTEYLCYGI